MNKSTYLATKLLDHLLGGAAFSQPVTLYLELYTAAPNAGGGGTPVSGGGYARKSVALATIFGTPASGAAKSNTVEVVFPFATASWGTVVAVGIFDAVTAGNLLFFGTLTTPRAVDTDQAPTFPIGDIDFTEA
jgi:hypothetical protein